MPGIWWSLNARTKGTTLVFLRETFTEEMKHTSRRLTSPPALFCGGSSCKLMSGWSVIFHSHLWQNQFPTPIQSWRNVYWRQWKGFDFRPEEGMPIQKAVCFLLAGLIKDIRYSYKVCLTYFLAVPSTAIQLKLCLAYRDTRLRTYVPLQVLLLDLSIWMSLSAARLWMRY